MKITVLAVLICASGAILSEAAPQLVVEQPVDTPLVPRRIVAWGYNNNGQTTVPAGLTNVQAIAAGADHSVALRSDGTVLAWGGLNSAGQTSFPAGLSGVQAVSAGGRHSLALKNDGVMVVVGWNNFGTDMPAGEGNIKQVSAGGSFSLAVKTDGTPRVWGGAGLINLPGGISGVDTIAAGHSHALALLRDGRITAWGSNFKGERLVPAGLEGVQAIAAGGNHNLALKRDGTVVGWGDDFRGQATVPAGLTNVHSLAAGVEHSVALKRDGTVMAWGNNSYGESSVPAGLSGVQAIAAGATHTLALAGSTVEFAPSEVGAAGETRTFKIRNTGSSPLNLAAVTVGGGNAGEFMVDAIGMPASLPALTGETTFTVTFNPAGLRQRWTNLRILSDVSEFGALLRGTGQGSQMIVFNGTGNAVANERIDNTGIHIYNNTLAGSRRSQTFTIENRGNRDLSALSLKMTGDTADFEISPLGSSVLAPYATVSLSVSFAPMTPGLHHGVVEITNGDAPGSPFRIPLEGFATTGRAFSLETPVGTPVTQRALAWGDEGSGNPALPAGLDDVTAVTSGTNHGLALKRDGKVITWKANPTSLLVPAGLADVMAIAAGDVHSVALKRDGTLVAWGDNSFGQTAVPAGLRDVSAITAGFQHTVALKRDGTLVAWGNNTYGQTTIPAGLNDVKEVIAGYYHNLVLKNDGSVVAWGRNDYGQRSVPSGLTGVLALAAGAYHSVALRADRTVLTWGRNDYGQSVVPAGLNNVEIIAAGRNHTMAQQSDGSILAWGRNDRGQLKVPTGLIGVQSLAGGIYQNVARAGSILPFGVLDPATSSEPKNLTLRNTGNMPLTISRISIIGKHAADFSIDPAPAETLLATNGSTMGFGIRFTPGGKGPREASLKIEGNADADPVLWTYLTGTGSSQATIRDWRQLYFNTTAPEGNAADLADVDSDGVPNLLEFALGTDPVSPGSGGASLQYSGTFAGNGTINSTGQPITRWENVAGVDEFRALFVRRRDYVEAGLTYYMQFSRDLSQWSSYVTQPTVLAENETHQIVSLPYPVVPGGQRARFARLRVILAP